MEVNPSLQPLPIKNKLASTPKTSPQFHLKVKNNKGEENLLVDPKATRAMVALMNQHAVIGGAAAHWGGPAAFAEIMSSVHGYMFQESEKQWYQNFNFVNDAGHTENGVYALRANYGFDDLTIESLKGFRSIDSKLTGHGESHLNPQGVYISNGPLGSGLPQAQGLAIADKVIGNDRVTICTISDGASMEGEAKESFAAIPGLASKEKLNPFLMLVSDNNTKLSGRIDQDSFSMSPTFESLESLGWEVITVKEGHNLFNVHQEIGNALDKVKANPKKPIAIIFKTIKGYGVKSTEESSSGGHGYPLKPFDEKLSAFVSEIYDGEVPEVFSKWVQEIEDAKPVESPAKKASNGPVNEKVQPGLARAAIRATKEGLPLFSISSDLQGSTGIAAFHKEFPERSLDIGVAESNMVSTAIGLSKQGLIPMIDTFAQFAITKGNLPLIMSSLSQGPIIGLLSHTGFQDAADGASHQATTYFSTTASIPGVRVVSVSCSKEAEAYMYQAIQEFKKGQETDKNVYSYLFFYGRENFPEYYNESETYEWLKPQTLIQGKDALIVATGPMVSKALKAHDILLEKGIKVTVVNHPFVNEIENSYFANQLTSNQNRLVTIEDHQIQNGMGSLLTQSLKINGQEFRYKAIGNKGQFGQSAYKADQLYALHEMDEVALVKAVEDLVKQ
ncbi:transketolase C-terminal domain-containing protein [Bacteriovoracaceae bacterium]|nr:transketolase C-terminal domain-containing protein [Bacteriovoracaceae bacterium]